MYNFKYVIDDIFELPGYIIYLCDFSFLLYMLYWILYKEALSKRYWIPKLGISEKLAGQKNCILQIACGPGPNNDNEDAVG